MKMYNNTAWSNGRESFTFFNPATTFRNNLAHEPLVRYQDLTHITPGHSPVTVSNAQTSDL